MLFYYTKHLASVKVVRRPRHVILLLSDVKFHQNNKKERKFYFSSKINVHRNRIMAKLN